MHNRRPVRIQRSRAKGSRLESPNGLPIVTVSRPSKWGNPFANHLSGASEAEKKRIRKEAAETFRAALLAARPTLSISVAEVKRELRGKNLACWCPLDGACHADTLLEIANAVESQ